MLEQFQDVLESYLESDKQIITVAYSGGVDSTVLLHLAKTYCEHSGNPLRAIYINHGLSANSDTWQAHCQSQCNQLNIEFTAALVKVIEEGQGIEAAARRARYKKLAELTDENTLVLLGQHADDQIETFFLQLLRGAGIDGLSAMPVYKQDNHSRQYLRPLLSLGRGEIEQYANALNLKWIEDESNADNRFDRNYLRNQVLPLLKQRWPQYQSTIARSVGHIAQHRDLLKIQADKTLASLIEGESLDLGLLATYETAWQRVLLKKWLKKLTVAQPSSAQVQQLLLQCVDAREDSTPVVRWGSAEARVFNNKLYILRDWPEVSLPSISIEIGRTLNLDSYRQGLGELSINASSQNSHFLQSQRFEIQFKGFSRKFKPPGERFSKPLSQWFKIWKLPPWARGLVPLVCIEDTVISVGNAINENVSNDYYLLSDIKVEWRHHLHYKMFPFEQ